MTERLKELSMTMPVGANTSEASKVSTPQQVMSSKGQIFFPKGQILEARSFVINLIKKASKSVIIIDNYVDNSILELLTEREKGVKAIIYTEIKKPSSFDLKKHNSQYPRLQVALKKIKDFHGRYIVLDRNEAYISSDSFKDLGRKCGFMLTKLDNENVYALFKDLKQNMKNETLRLPEQNTVFIIGRLVRDPKLRCLTSGKTVCTFDVVVSRKIRDVATGEWKDSEPTYVAVQVWEIQAERYAEKLKQSFAVHVEGRLRTNHCTGADGQKRSRLEVVATKVQFLTK